MGRQHTVSERTPANGDARGRPGGGARRCGSRWCSATLGEQVRVARGPDELADTGIVEVAGGGLGGHAGTVASRAGADPYR